MADFSYLLGAQPVATPNPLALATQGMTLAELMQRQEMGALNLNKLRSMAAAFQDPDVLKAYSGLMSGGGGAAPDGSPGGGFDMSPFAKYGLAAPELVSGALGTAEKAAAMRKNLAEASKAAADEQNIKLTQTQRFADSLGANPTPQQANALVNWLQDARVDPRRFDTSNPAAFAQSVAAGLQDPKVRQDIIASTATTAKTKLETAQMPAELRVKQSEAQSAAMQAQTARWKYLGGDQVEDVNSGDRYQVAPDPNDPTKMKATPIAVAGGAGANAAAGAPGQTFRSGMPAPEKELLVKNAENAATMEAGLPSAYEGLNSVYRLRNAVSKGEGIYSGPIRGSDFFKSISGVLSQLPGASDSMREKVGNTQAWESEGGELAFNMLSSLKGSVPRAQSALTQIRQIKPNTMMTHEAQLQVLNAIEQRFQDQIAFTRKASTAVRGGKTLGEVPAPAGNAMGDFNMNSSGVWEYTPK